MIELCIGKSMPNICRLALVRTTTKYTNLTINDVIVFRGNDRHYYVHRIIKLNDEKFTTKGDCFLESKPYEIDVPIQNIQGKVIWSYPKR